MKSRQSSSSAPGLCSAPFLQRLPAAAALLAALAVSLAAPRAHAANGTWVNHSGTTDWTTNSSWNGATYPGTSGSDVATFTGNEVSNPNLANAVTLDQLDFTTTGTNYTITASAPSDTLTLLSGTAIDALNVTGTNTISANIVLGESAGTTVGIIAGGQTGFGVGQGGTLVISGNISSTNAIAGITLQDVENSVGIVLVLSGSNSFAGNTNLSFQQLDINSTYALSSGTLLVNNNNTRINNTSGGAVTVANGMRLEGGLVFLGNTANNNLTFNGASVMATGFTNVIAVTGGGNMIFGSGGVNWQTVQTQEGTVDNGDGGNAQGTLTLNGAGSGAGASVTLSGVTYNSTFLQRSGTLALGSANPFGTGVLEVIANETSGSGSPVALQASSALGSTVITNAILMDSGSLNFNGSNNFQSSGSFIKSNNIASGTIFMTNTGTTSLGSLFISDNASSSQTLTINVAGAAGGAIVSGSINNSTVATSGSGSLILTGPGALTLTGSSTYTGSTAVQSGTLVIGSGGDLGAATSVALGSSGTTGIFQIGNAAGTASQTIAGLTVVSGTGQVVGGNSGTSTLTISNNGIDTYSGVLGGAGTNQNNLALTVIGTGTTTLSGSSTYTGATSGSAGLFSLTGTLGSGGGSAVTNNAAFSESSSGVIAGASSFTNAAGSGTLSGVNSYSGSTIVTGGTLTVKGAGSINSSTGITINGSGAEFLQSGTVASTPSITLTQGTLAGNGTVGAVTVGNNTGGIVSNGTNGGSTSTLTIGNLTFSGTGTIYANYGGSTPIVVTGTLGTLNNGSGEITISGSSLSWISGTNNLISFGALTGGITDFTSGSFFGVTARDTTQSLVNTGTSIALVLAGDSPVWTGTATGIWSTGVTGSPTSPTPDWVLKNGHTTTDFWAGDIVAFNDTYVVGSSTLTPNANVEIGGTVGPTSVTFNNNSVAYVITGSNGSSGIVGGAILTQAGSGTTTLGANNSYTGATNVNAGTLILTGTLGSTAITTGSGATFTENAGALIGGAASLTNNGITNISGSNNYTGTTAAASGTLALVTSGTLNGSPVTVASGAVFTEDAASAITGAATLVTSGSVSLAGNNSYTGVTTLTTGTLNLSGTLAKTQITVGTGALFNESSTGAVSGSSSLTNNGVTNILDGSSANNYTGATTNSGTLQFGDGTTGHDGLISGTTITNTGLLTFDYNGNQTYAGAITGAGTVSSIGTGTATLTGSNTYIGPTSIGGGATLLIGSGGSLGTGSSGTPEYSASAVSANIYAGAITANGTLVYSGTPNMWLTGVISGSGGLVLNGGTGGGPTTIQSPTLTLTNGGNTFSGGLTINGGMVTTMTTIDGTAAALGTGTITANGGQLTLGSGLTINNNIVLQGGGIFSFNGTDVLAGQLTINSGSSTSYLGAVYNSAFLNISGLVSGTGNVTLAHAALIDPNGFQSNRVEFTNAGSSTYSGTVTIANDGWTTLYLDGTNALANATINVQNATGDAGSLVNGTAQAFVFANGITSATIGGLSSGTATSAFGNVALINTGSGALALSVGSNNTNQTFSGTLTGAGSLVKIGTGTQTLTGTNSYTGVTTISGGALQLGTGTSGSDGTINTSASIVDNANLVFDYAGSQTYTKVISGSGNVAATGTGSVTLTGSNTYSGTTNVTGGTFILGSAGSINHSAVININGSGAKFVQSTNIASTPSITLTQGTLTGSGTVGAVTVGNGTGGIITNGNGGTATLTLGSLSFGGAATVDVNYGGLTPLVVTGALSTNPGNGQVTINGTGVWSSGTDNLIGYGSFGGSITDFTLGTISALNPRQTISGSPTLVNTGSSIALSIIVTGGDFPVWTGTATGIWTTGISGTVGATPNWALAGAHTATDFWNGDFTQFNDTYVVGSSTLTPANTGGTASVEISGTVAPTSTTFNNNLLSYVITGSNGSSGIVAGSLTMNGTNSVTLGANNSYTGSTNVNAGTLILTGSLNGTPIAVATGAAFSETAAGTINGASTLATSGSSALAGNNAYTGATVDTGTLALSGSLTGGGTVTVGTGATFTETSGGSISNTPLITVGTGATFTEAAGGAISGGTFTTSGSSTLSGSNTFTGATTMNAGSLTLNGTLNGSPVVLNSGTFTESSSGLIAGGNPFTNSGGISTLGGSNSYTGTTTVSSGSLGITGTLGNTAVLLTGGTLSLQSAGAIHQNTLTAGNGTLVETVANAIGGSASVNVAAAGSLTLSNANNYTGNTSIGTGATLTITNASAMGTGALNMTSSNGTLNVLVNGGGTIVVANNLNYNSSTPQTINVGNDGSGTGGVVEFTGVVTMGDNQDPSVLNVTGSNGYSLDFAAVNYGNFHVAQLEFNPTTALVAIGTYNGGSSQASTLILNGTNTGNVIGSITQPGSAVLTVIKSNSSTWTLTGASNYTGSTTISGGTLQLGIGVSGSDGTISSSSNIVDNASLVYDYASSETYGGSISGTGAITVEGPGSLTLTGTSTNTGTTTIAGGASLFLGNGVSGSNGTVSGQSFVDSGSLVFDYSGNQSAVASISGTGALAIEGTGTTSLGGTSTLTGVTTINSGATLQLGASGTDGVITVSPITNSGALIFNPLNIETYSGTLSGTGAVTMNGAGTQKLSGNNTYTGPTTVNNGILQLGGSNALGSTSQVTVNNGAELNVSNGVSPQTVTLTGTGSSGSGLVLNNGAILGFGVGNGVADELVLQSGSVTANGTILINLAALSGTASNVSNFTIISAPGGGLSGAAFTIGSIPSLSTVSLAGSTDTTEVLNFSAPTIFTVYWFGATPTGVNEWVTNNPAGANWTSDAAGTMQLSNLNGGNGEMFGVQQDVIFSGSGAGVDAPIGEALTALGGPVSAHSLTINDPTLVTVQGDGNTLTLGGTSGVTGINVGAAAGTDPTFGGQPVFGANILFTGSSNVTVNDPLGLLITGAISGSNGLVVNGSTILYLASGGASTYTGGTQLLSGTLSFTQDGDLGQSGTGNGVTINPGSGNFATLMAGSSSITTASNRAFVFASGTGVIDVPVGDSLTIGGVLSGTGALNKTDLGTLNLSGADTAYTGAITLSAGALQLGNTTALGGTNTSLAINSGTLDLNGFNPVVGVFSGGSGGVVTQITSTGTSTLTVNSGSVSSLYAGVITNGSGTVALVQAGSGTLTLTGANTYTGSTAVQNGVLQLGTGGSLASATTLTLGSGTTSGVFELGDGGSAVNQTVSGLTVAGTGTASAVVGGNSTVSTLTVSTTGTVADVYTGVLGGAGTNQNNLGLTVGGTNILTLTNVNTYTGSTIVTGGTLQVSGTGSINNSSAIAINGSGAEFIQAGSVASTPAIALTQGTLEGNGTVGAVTVGNNTGGIVTNGIGGSAATLAMSSLSFSGTGTVDVNYGGSTPVAVTGALVTDNAHTGEVTINGTGAWAPGLNNLISFGSLTGGITDFTQGTFSAFTSPRETTGTLVDTGTSIALSVNGDSPVWTGTATGIWSTGVTGGPTSATPDWALLNAHTTTDFWAGDYVQFNDTYVVGSSTLTPANTGGTATVEIGGTVGPSATTFNNNILSYVITGSNGSSGIVAGSVTMNGSSTTTIATNNSYAGATNVNAGTLIFTGAGNTFTGPVNIGGAGTLMIGGAGSLGSGSFAGAITDNGTFNYNSTANQTLSGVISGTGTLVLNGSTGGGPLVAQTGSVTLTQANTYSGGTLLNGGMLSIIGGNNSGLGTGTVTVNGGDFLFSNQTVANNFVLSGGGIFGGDIVNTISGSLTINTGSTASYLGETYNTRTLNITGQLFGSGNVTLAHTTLETTGFQGANIQFSNSGSSTYNGTITIGDDALTTLYLDGTYALANATVNVQDAQGNAANGDTGKPFVFGSNTGTNTITAATIGGLSSGTVVSGFGNVALVNTGSGALALTVGNNNTNQSFSGALTGAGSLTKIGTGTQTLNGNSSYTGATAVNVGTLQVNGSIALSSGVTISSGATLAGSGVVSNISGAGTVAPGGNSILTATQADPTSGMSFHFQFSGSGSPNYASPTASVNDVLHLTGATPLVSALTAANTIAVNFTGLVLHSGEVFYGGLFTDAAIANSIVQNATFVYTGLGGNTVQFEGMATVASAAFSTGTVSGGEVMQFDVTGTPVPAAPPWALVAAGAGLLIAAWRRARGKDSSVKL